MADDKNGKDSGDKTHQQPLRPPVPKPPQPDKPGASGEGEHTVMGGRPPAVPKPPAAPPPPAAAPPETAPDRTVMAGGPPVMPKPAAPPAAAPPAPAASAPPAPPARAADEDEGATVILARATQGGCSLQRLQPPGHGADVVKLTQDSYVMGRSRSCDIQLFSTTASRAHARLMKRGDGWYILPEEGKTVLAGGSTVKNEARLTHKMRLQLGGDELLFFDEGVATASPTAASAPPSAGGGEAEGSRTMWIVAIVVVLAAAAAAAWLFLNP